MKARTLTLASIAMVAVVALAALGGYRLASATGPDVNNDGYVSGQDFFAVLQAFGQAVPTPSPSETATSTPSPTPTRIPGMLDVEVGLAVSTNSYIGDDLQPFSISITMYNHGDNPSPEIVSALIETQLESGEYLNPVRFDASGPYCNPGFNFGGVEAGFVIAGQWITQGLNHSGNYGLQTVSPGMETNDHGVGKYRLHCYYHGYWSKGGLAPLTENDTATITVSLRDANGDPLIDGNAANNVDVETVELIVP